MQSKRRILSITGICHSLFHTTVLQNKQSRFHSFKHVLFDFLLDLDPELQFRIHAKVPDPCKSSGSMRIRIRNTAFRRTGVADPHHYLDTNPYVRDGENPDPDLWCELCSVAHGLDFKLKRKGRREICTVHVE